MKKRILSLIVTLSMLSSFCVFSLNVNAAEKIVAQNDFSDYTDGLTHAELVSSAYNGTTYREDGWGTKWGNTGYRNNIMSYGGIEYDITDDGSGTNKALRVKRNVFSSNKEYPNGKFPAGYYDTEKQAWQGTNTEPDSGTRVQRKLDENFTNGKLKATFRLKFAGGAQEATIGFGGLSSSTGYDSIGIRKNEIRGWMTHGWENGSRVSYSGGKKIQDNEWYDVSITLDTTAESGLKVTAAITGTFGATTRSTQTVTWNLFSGKVINSCDIGNIYFRSDRTLDLADVSSFGTNTSSVWYVDDIVVTKDEPVNAVAKLTWAQISNNQAQTEVIDNLNLIKTINVEGEDCSLTWTTSDADAVGIDGTVYPGKTAKTATLTATDNLGNTKQFEVTVPSTAEIGKYLVRTNFDKYELGDAKAAIIWTRKYSNAVGCYTNYNVVEDEGSNALHIERTVFSAGSGTYKNQNGEVVTASVTPDSNERYMPEMKEHITSDEKVQIDTRVKFIEDSSTFSVRFDGMSASGYAPLVEIQTDEMINCIGGYQRVSFPSKWDSGEYADISIVMDFPASKITLTVTGKSGGVRKTQTITGNMSKVVMNTLDIPSIGLMSRHDTSVSKGVYVDYFRVKDITDSALNAVTWDAISNSQDIANVTEAVKLDKKVTYNGTEYNITWTSSDETVITSNGAVARPFVDTAVTLTATLDSGASKTFTPIVRSTEPAVVSSNFDDYNATNGTAVNGLGGVWSETLPSGARKGVKYTVAQDPTNADNQVMKAERHVLTRGGVWVDGNTGAVATGDLQTWGPDANDLAKATFAEPVTDGKVTLSTRIMFTEGTAQSIDFMLYGLYDVNTNNNVLLINRDAFRFWGYKPATISYGGFKAIPYEWYNVFFTLDIDNGTYELKIGDLTFSGKEEIADDDMEQLTGIGIYSNRTADTVATGTSVWYVDDVVVKKGLSNANAVKLAKENLSLPETVTADITLPTAGLEETTITWETKDDKIITKDGVITYSADDKTVKLIATIEKGTASETKEFTITVPGVMPYAVKSVNVLTPNGDMGKSLIGGGEIKSVDVYKYYAIADDAKAYVALYDTTGRLWDVASADITATAVNTKARETVTLDKSIRLPENISGLVMKVFIWSGVTPVAELFDNDTPETELIIVGDSIACYYPASAYPQQGWGEYLDKYLSDKVTINNRAHGGYSTRTYLETTSTDSWDTVTPQISTGDYVLISLGHNDANTAADTRYTTIDQYKANLRTFINDTRALGATPILITNSVAVRTANAEQTNTDRVKAMNEIGGEMGVVCLDLNLAMYNDFKSKDMTIIRNTYFMSDNLHLNETGADYCAGLIIDLLGDTDSELAKYIK